MPFGSFGAFQGTPKRTLFQRLRALSFSQVARGILTGASGSVRRWVTGDFGEIGLQGLRFRVKGEQLVLGGSWVVISGVISPLIGVITIVTLIITPLITSHEPPSSVSRLRNQVMKHTQDPGKWPLLSVFSTSVFLRRDEFILPV